MVNIKPTLKTIYTRPQGQHKNQPQGQYLPVQGPRPRGQYMR